MRRKWRWLDPNRLQVISPTFVFSRIKKKTKIPGAFLMDLLQRWKVEGKKKIMIIYFVPEKKGEHVMCAEVEGKKKCWRKTYWQSYNLLFARWIRIESRKLFVSASRCVRVDWNSTSRKIIAPSILIYFHTLVKQKRRRKKAIGGYVCVPLLTYTREREREN